MHTSVLMTRSEICFPLVSMVQCTPDRHFFDGESTDAHRYEFWLKGASEICVVQCRVRSVREPLPGCPPASPPSPAASHRSHEALSPPI